MNEPHLGLVGWHLLRCGLCMLRSASATPRPCGVIAKHSLHAVESLLQPAASPLLLPLQFTCQQINCTRDSFGNVVDGKPDEVHRVYYFW